MRDIKQTTIKSNKIDMDDVNVFEYTGNGQTVPEDVVSVRFHSSVIEVEEKAFMDCIQLIEVTLNNGLLRIGDNAFTRCSSLQSINIPSTVIKIGKTAFSGCTGLSVVELNEGLQKIGQSAFKWCQSLQSISIPSTVNEIGSNAFEQSRFNSCTKFTRCRVD